MIFQKRVHIIVCVHLDDRSSTEAVALLIGACISCLTSLIRQKLAVNIDINNTSLSVVIIFIFLKQTSSKKYKERIMKNGTAILFRF